MNEKSTEVATAQTTPAKMDLTGQARFAHGSLKLLPANMQEAVQVATMMSKSGFAVPPALRGNAGACLAVARQAWDWGMNEYAVAQKTYIVTKKGGEEMIAFEAQLVNAVVNTRAPLQRRLSVTYSGEGAARKCHVRGLLIGEDNEKEYDSPPMANITVQNSPLWKSDPDQQLHYYSVRAWARRWTPEVLLGVYTHDEIEAMTMVQYPDGSYGAPGHEPPPRPTAEAQRIADQREADEPKDFYIVDEYGEVVAETLGPRAFTEELVKQYRTYQDKKDPKAFDHFFANNSAMIDALKEANFPDHAHDLRHDADIIRKSFRKDWTGEEGHEPETPVQAGEEDGALAGTESSPATSEAESEAQGAPESDEATSEGGDGSPEGSESPPEAQNGAQEESAKNAQAPAGEENSAGGGAEASSDGNGATPDKRPEPPKQIVWWTAEGKQRRFNELSKWLEFVLEGVKGDKITAPILKDAKTKNAQLFGLLVAVGGEHEEAATKVMKAIEARLAELAE